MKKLSQINGIGFKNAVAKYSDMFT